MGESRSWMYAKEKKGIFVLVKTSITSSGEFQDQVIINRPLYELVGESGSMGRKSWENAYSYVGAVVGQPIPRWEGAQKICQKAYILVPGYGAQGGRRTWYISLMKDGLGAIVNSSRGIIAAYKQEKYQSFGPENFGDASRAAVEDMVKDIKGALESRA